MPSIKQKIGAEEAATMKKFDLDTLKRVHAGHA